MPRFKSIIFYLNSSNIKLFLQKNAKFSSAGLRPQTPSLRQLGALPPDPIGIRWLGARPPDPQNRPLPITNFWLRAWYHFLPLTLHAFQFFLLLRNIHY